MFLLRIRYHSTESLFFLQPGPNTVGRSLDCAVVLGGPEVSRRHAILHVHDDGLEIQDLSSRNGTHLGGRRVQRAPLEPGDQVRIGAAQLTLEQTEDADLALAIELAIPPEETRDASTLGSPPADSPKPSMSNQSTSIAVLRPQGQSFLPRLRFPEGYRLGSSRAARDMICQLQVALRNDRPVLIRGETGVGKERIAQTLHRSSSRRRGPWVAINCAAIPAAMLEAELFGIGRGVATGVRERLGCFERAAGGTLFLDEIGEIAPEVQVKLLRALQEGEIQPVGGRPRKIDLRVLAATNLDLQQRMENGGFRRDLYFRLGANTVEVPALRDCRDDLVGLVEHFLEIAAVESGLRVRGVTHKALRRLLDYPWPGNVRELENEIHRLVCKSLPGAVLDAPQLSPEILEPKTQASGPRSGAPRSDSLTLAPRIHALEKRLIREALRRSSGEKKRAAQSLGLSRNGLAKKMRRLGISP